jgi:hypothetical protein
MWLKDTIKMMQVRQHIGKIKKWVELVSPVRTGIDQLRDVLLL